MNHDIVSFFQSLMQQCESAQASDCHIEPYGSEYSIRIRVDGLLEPLLNVNTSTGAQLVNHIKLQAGCNTAESRLPQDGRIGKSIRLSVIKTIFGEKCVLRFLKSSDLLLPFNELGFLADQAKRVKHALAKPQGLILVTGPTGSGKTTTLYSLMSELNAYEKCICTIEDPVESTLDHINQIQVKPKIGLTFAAILRSLLRQDPDVIMVGEIRDSETANLALKAAQTGHLVFATLHTNSAAESITRLKHLGCDDLSLSSALSLIIAQRLIRLKHNEGFKGRRAIYEVLEISQTLKNNILNQQPISVPNMTSLKDHGLLLANDDMTTLEEVNRVCA